MEPNMTMYFSNTLVMLKEIWGLFEHLLAVASWANSSNTHLPVVRPHKDQDCHDSRISHLNTIPRKISILFSISLREKMTWHNKGHKDGFNLGLKEK